MAQPALKIRYPLSNPTLIEAVITRGLPYLDVETANMEIIRLTLDNIVLQARIDALTLDNIVLQARIDAMKIVMAVQSDTCAEIADLKVRNERLEDFVRVVKQVNKSESGLDGFEKKVLDALANLEKNHEPPI